MFLIEQKGKAGTFTFLGLDIHPDMVRLKDIPGR
jgi:hypothetical protein